MYKFKSKSIIYIFVGVFLITAGFMFFGFESIAAESESKGQIAYVDLWAIFNVHPEKPVAESKLNQLAQSMQIELEEKAKDLPNEEQQNLLKEYQTRLSQQEQGLIQEIIDSIKDDVIEVAKVKEVRMVLDKANVIYGGYDITDDIIDYIEENYTAEIDSEIINNNDTEGAQTDNGQDDDDQIDSSTNEDDSNSITEDDIDLEVNE
ncbi:MAG: OmpH family outer membrane protein [Halanaerobiales bacterium]